MDKRYFKGAKSDQDKAQIKNHFNSASILRGIVVRILEDELVAVRRDMRNEDNFEKASWSEFVARKLGEETQIIKLIKLMSDRTEEK